MCAVCDHSPGGRGHRDLDGKVTGGAGGSEKMLFKIREGRIQGDRMTVEASPKEGVRLRFVLTVKGDVMEGEVLESSGSIGTATRLKRERGRG